MDKLVLSIRDNMEGIEQLEEKKKKENIIQTNVVFSLKKDKDLPNSVMGVLEGLPSPTKFIHENVRDTCMHIAARIGNLELVLMLLENGCRIDIKNAYDEVPFEVCESPGVIEVLRQVSPLNRSLNRSLNQSGPGSFLFSPIKKPGGGEMSETVEETVEFGRSFGGHTQDRDEELERSRSQIMDLQGTIDEMSSNNEKLAKSFRSVVKQNVSVIKELETEKDSNQKAIAQWRDKVERERELRTILEEKSLGLKTGLNKSLGRVRQLQTSLVQKEEEKQRESEDHMRKVQSLLSEKDELRENNRIREADWVLERAKLMREHSSRLDEVKRQAEEKVTAVEKVVEDLRAETKQEVAAVQAARERDREEFEERMQEMAKAHETTLLEERRRLDDTHRETLSEVQRKCETKVENLQRMRDELVAKAQKTREEVNEEKRKVAEREAEMKRYQKEVEKESSKRVSEDKMTKMQIRELEIRAKNAERQLKRTEQEGGATLEEMKEEYESKIKELELASSKTVQELKEAHSAEVRNLIEEYTEKVERGRKENSSLVEGVKLEYSQRQEEVKTLLEAEKEEVVKAMEEQHRLKEEALNLSISNLSSKNEEMSHTMSERISILEANLVKKKKKFAQVSKEKIEMSSTMQLEISELKDENNTLVRQVDKLKIKVKDLSARMLEGTKKLTDEITRLKREKDIAVHKTLEMQSVVEEIRVKGAGELKGLREKLLGQIAVLRKEKTDLKRELDSEICDLEKANRVQDKKAQEEMDELRARFSEEVREFQARIVDLEQGIKTEQTKSEIKMKSLKKMKEDLKKKNKKLEVQVLDEKSEKGKWKTACFLALVTWVVLLLFVFVNSGK